MEEPAHGLASDQGGDRNQRRRVEQGRDDFGALETICVPRCGCAPAQPAREDRQPQRSDIRQIVRRVGQQRQASGPQSSGEFDKRDAEVESRTSPQPPVEISRFNFVTMVRHAGPPAAASNSSGRAKNAGGCYPSA
jgi:hypothetical protein